MSEGGDGGEWPRTDVDRHGRTWASFFFTNCSTGGQDCKKKAARRATIETIEGEEKLPKKTGGGAGWSLRRKRPTGSRMCRCIKGGGGSGWEAFGGGGEDFLDAVVPGVLSKGALFAGGGDGVVGGGVAEDVVELLEHFVGGAEGDAFLAGFEEGGEFALVVGDDEAVGGGDVEGPERHAGVYATAEEVEGGFGEGIDFTGVFAGVFGVGAEADGVPAFADEGEAAVEMVGGSLDHEVA